MKKEQRTEYNEVIGITHDNEIFILDSTFCHADDFHGACGTRLSPLSQEYVDKRNDPDNVKGEYTHLWKESVQNGSTEESLEDFVESLIRESDCNGGLFIGHDDSSVRYLTEDFKKEYFPDAVGFECIGGGRMFDASIKPDDFKVLLRPDLLQEIIKFETQKESKK